jgi:hypothetical protein
VLVVTRADLEHILSPIDVVEVMEAYERARGQGIGKEGNL